MTRGHVQLAGQIRRGHLTALCGAVIRLRAAPGLLDPPPDGSCPLMLAEAWGEPCDACAAREAARRLGARFAACGACGACGGTGGVARADSALTACMNCGGRGVYQLGERDPGW